MLLPGKGPSEGESQMEFNGVYREYMNVKWEIMGRSLDVELKIYFIICNVNCFYFYF